MEDMTLNMRTATVLALLIVGGCSPSPKGMDAGPAAGLDAEILKWRGEIVATDRLCRNPGEKCQGFAVACKAMRTLSPQDTAGGITARVVAAINWNGWDPKTKESQSGSETVEFAKGAAGWVRTPHKPVNLSTCADA